MRLHFPHIAFIIAPDPAERPFAAWGLGRCIDFAVAFALGLWCL